MPSYMLPTMPPLSWTMGFREIRRNRIYLYIIVLIIINIIFQGKLI